MAQQIFIDKTNKIYLSETTDGQIELSVEANSNSVVMVFKDMQTLDDFIQKLSILDYEVFQHVQV